ncbi:ABC transporter permease [Microbacterium sp. G2-8]|uniref:ABC transporter permease n=1 Tax=Microbacterium sp. G2-8 TaxID=2842454 RepID=UPI001C89DCB5|nr:ABC transporter permease [Microbacterium sp. G2-8]
MNLSRLGVLIGLDLRQRVRRPGFYVLAGIFFVIVCAITWLGSLIFASMRGAGLGMFSIAIYGVLLMVVLVTPTFTGNAINGERDQATLAPVQVTLSTTAEILVAKLLAGWITGLAYLAVALPALIYAAVQGSLAPPTSLFGSFADVALASEPESSPVALTLLVSVLVLAVEIGIIAAIGVGLSAVIARPLFSVAATYLLVMLLTVGTLIAFGLSTLATRVDTSLLTEEPETYSAEWIDDEPQPIRACDEGETPPTGDYCVVDRDDLSPTCVEIRGWSEGFRTDRVWWVLAANPFVIVADATPTVYDSYGSPVDAFGGIKSAVRSAQIAPETEQDAWDSPCGGRVVGDPPTAAEVEQSTVPSWFAGLALQIVLAVGLMLWGAARTRTPSRRTPPGSRIA